MRRKPWPTPSGFTLLEVLIALSILSILLALGMPFLRNALQDQKVKNAVADMHLSLVYARNEAIKRNANVDVVPVGGWTGGWNVRSGVTVLRSMEARPDLTISGPAGSITYQRNGRLAAPVTEFRFSVTGNGSVTMRCLAISVNGLPHLKVDSDLDTSNGCNS